MACKHCNKEMDEHSFLSCTCPKYATNGVRIGYDYGNEYEEEAVTLCQSALDTTETPDA